MPHNTTDTIQVEVVYALPDDQTVHEVNLPAGATVLDALRKSGLLDKTYSDESLNIVPHVTPVGIFGERVSVDDILDEGDRVEVYRSLALDPMEARRVRAQTQKQTRK